MKREEKRERESFFLSFFFPPNIRSTNFVEWDMFLLFHNFASRYTHTHEVWAACFRFVFVAVEICLFPEYLPKNDA